MKQLCIVLSVIAIFSVGPARAEPPIKIGFIYLMSGRLATAGTTSKQGAEMAIDEINESGGIGGRKVEGIYRDTKGDPGLAVEEVKNLVLKEGVSAVMGIISSNVALAVSPVCNELKVPLMVTSAQAREITGSKCNRHTFRITWSNNENLKTAVIVAAKTKATKWTTVGPDYAFGAEAWAAFQAHLKKAKPDASFASNDEVALVPIQTTDFAPHIKKIIDSGANGILVTLFGGNVIDFIRQGNEMGLFGGSREVLVAVDPMTAFTFLGTEVPPGI